MQHFKWTLILSMLAVIFLIPAHGAKAANGPAEGEGGYAYIGFADYQNDTKYVYCAPHTGTSENVAGASYDKASNTLTLNGYSSSTLGLVTNMMGDDFKIRLIGENHVQQLAVWGDGWGCCVEFVGDGKLYVNEKNIYMDGIVLTPLISKACVKVSGNAAVYSYAPDGGKPLYISAAMTNRADETVIGKGSLDVKVEDAYLTEEQKVSVITGFSDFKTQHTVYKKDGSDKKYAVSTGTLNGEEAYFVSEILECDELETSPFLYEVKSAYGAFDAAKEGLTETTETVEAYDVWQLGLQSLYKERATGESCIFVKTDVNGSTVYQKYHLSTPYEVTYDEEESGTFYAAVKDKDATFANLWEINLAGYEVVENRTKLDGYYTFYVDGLSYTLKANETETCHHLFTTQEVQKKAGFDTDGVLLKKCRDCGVIISRITIPKVSNVSLLQTVFSYDGKAKTPKVTVKDSTGQVLPLGSTYILSYPKNRKDVNRYAVSLTLTGGRYAGTKQLYFTVKPQATAFSKVKAGKKKMTLKWKKKSQISGYEVWYSTSKNMKKGVKKVVIKKAKKTSAVCKKLKSGKKYFVKIRTYKTVKQKNKSIKIVSNFSKVKSVKIK